MSKLFYSVLVLFVISCSPSTTTSDLQKIYGQQMVLPVNGQWRILNRDTTVVVSPDKPKILVYYNSQGCTSCRLKELLEWKGLVGDIKTLSADSSNAEFVFLFATGSDLRTVTTVLMQYNFDIPVLCDTQSEFEAKNLLPDKEMFHYFLLDQSGKVFLVGSPVGNPTMWQLYKRRIVEINNVSST